MKEIWWICIMIFILFSIVLSFMQLVLGGVGSGSFEIKNCHNIDKNMRQKSRPC